MAWTGMGLTWAWFDYVSVASWLCPGLVTSSSTGQSQTDQRGNWPMQKVVEEKWMIAQFVRTCISCLGVLVNLHHCFSVAMLFSWRDITGLTFENLSEQIVGKNIWGFPTKIFLHKKSFKRSRALHSQNKRARMKLGHHPTRVHQDDRKSEAEKLLSKGRTSSESSKLKYRYNQAANSSLGDFYDRSVS